MGLLDRRPGYYRPKIALTIFAFFAGWALFVIVGNSWLTLAVAPLLGTTRFSVCAGAIACSASSWRTRSSG
jgi:hypothetical protein